jgi:hydrogenase maturation factor
MAIPMHVLSIMQLPKWAIKDVEGICRVFLCKGQEEVNGGYYLIA